MFYESSFQILNTADSTSAIKELKGDIQPFTQTIVFEDGFKVDVTKRLFCDYDQEMILDRYVLENDQKFKIMFIEKWSDYLDVWLYLCKK